MHPEYRRIYDEQIELYRASQSFKLDRPLKQIRSGFNTGRNVEALARIDEAINTAIRTRRNVRELRPDARLALLVNLHQLVTAPMSDPKAPSRLDQGLLAEDVGKIIDAANEGAGDRNDLSAAQIFRGVAKVLDKLHIKDRRLWERDE